MIYLIKDGDIPQSRILNKKRIDYDDIYVSKDEKLEFIYKANGFNKRFMSIMSKIYPELDIIKRSVEGCGQTFSTDATFGLAIQFAIAIIENPAIICTGEEVKFDYQILPDLSDINTIKNIYYNGNYCLIRYNDFGIKRIFLSTTDKEYIPSVPEFVISNYYFTTSIYTSSYGSFSSDSILVHDDNLESFMNNSRLNRLKSVYIYIESVKHLKTIKTLSSLLNVTLLVYIKKIPVTDYIKLADFDFNMVFLDSEGSDLNPIQINTIFQWKNVYYEKSLNLDPKLTIDFRTFGLIEKDRHFVMGKHKVIVTGNGNISNFRKLRELNNLPYLDTEYEYKNIL